MKGREKLETSTDRTELFVTVAEDVIDGVYADKEGGMQIVPSATVYYPEEASLYLAGNVPLYLSWIIEGSDGKLYMVPSETDGWYRRDLYIGLRSKLRAVPAHEASTIRGYVYDHIAA